MLPTTESKLGKKRKHLISHYGRELRGLAINRYGGNQLQHEKGFRGLEPSPPGPVRIFTEDEKRAVERELRTREVTHEQKFSRKQEISGGPSNNRSMRFNSLVRDSLRGVKQSHRVRTSNIREWLLTDSPTSLSEWNDLREAIEGKARVGHYGVGVYYSGSRREPKDRKIRVSGPFRDLRIPLDQLSNLQHALDEMKLQGVFRPTIC